jgi:antitoxin component YwqK of YwqJK toxin-antitoxin module
MAQADAARERIDYHGDGSVRARGKEAGGQLHGYWEWFRKDGTRMRSGHFEHGVKTGEWITYDKDGGVYKVTKIKSKPAAK